MTLKVPFWKVQSIGNDFPLIHLPLEEGELSDLAIAICDRKFGVGGDGLLALENGDPLKLSMFNPDGTEDFCGNGLRCAAMHATQMGWAKDDFTIRHLDRDVQVRLDSLGEISTQLGRASYDPRDVPLKGGVSEVFDGSVYPGIKGSALTTGSTHVVIPASSLPGDEEFEDLGPKIENYEIYPNRTSVIWAQEIGSDHLKIRIWERGVGETLGCGTGSSAAAVDYLRRQGRGGRVQIDNRGGTIFVQADAWDAPITVFGRASQVFEGEFLWLTPSQESPRA